MQTTSISVIQAKSWLHAEKDLHLSGNLCFPAIVGKWEKNSSVPNFTTEINQ